MSDRPVLQPGPDHPITVTANPARVVVRVGDRVVADTTAALELREAAYPPVQYVPRADVDPAVLETSGHRTYCPYKGDSSYYGIRTSDGLLVDAVWTYDHPYPAVEEIAGYLAFYPDKVQLEVSGSIS